MNAVEYQRANIAYQRFEQAKYAAHKMNQERLDRAIGYGGNARYVTPEQLVENQSILPPTVPQRVKCYNKYMTKQNDFEVA